MFNKLKKYWFSLLVLFFFSLRGIIISICSKNLFLIWLGFEINMFSIIPFLSNESLIKKMGVEFYYFLVQVIGTILFLWGSILNSFNVIGLLGFFIKLGYFPFFVWVPSIIVRLSWARIFLISTIQKLPIILLFRLIFDYDRNLIVFISLITIVLSIFGMFLKINKLKNVFGWSSIIKTRFILVILSVSFNLALLYFIFYSIHVFFFCFCLYKSKFNKLWFNYNKLDSFWLIKGFFSFFFFSGLPPFLRFFYKILFIKKLMYLFWLEWVIIIIFCILLIVQVSVYINIFKNYFLNFNSFLKLIKMFRLRFILNFFFWMFFPGLLVLIF